MNETTRNTEDLAVDVRGELRDTYGFDATPHQVRVEAYYGGFFGQPEEICVTITGVNHTTIAQLVTAIATRTGQMPLYLPRSTAMVEPLLRIAAGLAPEQDTWSDTFYIIGHDEIAAIADAIYTGELFA
jgi:hypothetical protein